MTWMFIISTTIWVNGWDTSSVASRARSELTSSQCNWKGNRKGKGTDETPPYVLWPLVTVHTGAATIQVRKLFKGGNYMRKYGKCILPSKSKGKTMFIGCPHVTTI